MKKDRRLELIIQLKKTPIIEVSCKKLGIGRATYYRWKKEDQQFAEEAELAIMEGAQLVNDMAESQLINSIKEGNLTGIIFWLKNHHRNYSPKLEVTTKSGEVPLTDEQKEIIRQSLNMAFNLNSDIKDDGQQETTD